MDAYKMNVKMNAGICSEKNVVSVVLSDRELSLCVWCKFFLISTLIGHPTETWEQYAYAHPNAGRRGRASALFFKPFPDVIFWKLRFFVQPP